MRALAVIHPIETEEGALSPKSVAKLAAQCEDLEHTLRDEGLLLVDIVHGSSHAEIATALAIKVQMPIGNVREVPSNDCASSHARFIDTVTAIRSQDRDFIPDVILVVTEPDIADRVAYVFAESSGTMDLEFSDGIVLVRTHCR